MAEIRRLADRPTSDLTAYDLYLRALSHAYTQVGRELGVRYVLEGSVRRSGSRVRITAQLIETTAGAHLWADRFDGSSNSWR